MSLQNKKIININTVMSVSEIDEFKKKYALPNDGFYIYFSVSKADKVERKSHSQLAERLLLTIIFHLQEYNTYRWENILDFNKIASHFNLSDSKVNDIFVHLRRTIPMFKKALVEYKNPKFRRWSNYVIWLSDKELKRVNIREILYFFSNKTKQYQALEKEVRAKGKSMLDVFSKVSVDSKEKVFGIANLPQ